MNRGDPRPETPSAPPDRIDAELDDFEEMEVIGTGGNADVTKVSYRGDGPDVVALKQPRMQGTMDTDSMKRFIEEAETWDKIDDHEHIVGVLDWDSEPLPWIALEYMDGGSLEDRLGEMSVAEALWVGVCICRAVRHAHRKGIAHLDIKPENVLFQKTEGDNWDYPKVADWGLSKMLLEHSKSIEGLSPQYAAPEQFDAETYGKPDDITDIYAVGAVVYAALTGRPPFEGTAASVMQGVLNEEPEPSSEYVEGLPEGTDEVVMKALEKDKENRYESVLDLRRELEELVGEEIDEEQESTDTSTESEKNSSKTTQEPTGDRVSENTSSNTASDKRTEGKTPTQDITQAEGKSYPTESSDTEKETPSTSKKKSTDEQQKRKTIYFRIYTIASIIFGLIILGSLGGIMFQSGLSTGGSAGRIILLVWASVGTVFLGLGIGAVWKPITSISKGLVAYAGITILGIPVVPFVILNPGVPIPTSLEILLAIALVSTGTASISGYLGIKEWS